MFKSAIVNDDNSITYFDLAGNKYIARGGHLAWRISNPGLIKSHSRFAAQVESIGHFCPYAIFLLFLRGGKPLRHGFIQTRYLNHH